MRKRDQKIYRVLLTLLIVYGLLLVSGCVWQRKLLYFPTKLTPDEAKQLAAQEGFVEWQNPGG